MTNINRGLLHRAHAFLFATPQSTPGRHLAFSTPPFALALAFTHASPTTAPTTVHGLSAHTDTPAPVCVELGCGHSHLARAARALCQLCTAARE